MRFRNSLRLMMENFKQVYRLLFFKIIVALVAFALSFALIYPELSAILESPQFIDLFDALKVFVTEILAFDMDQVEITKEAIFASDGLLRQATSFLSTKILEIVLAVIGVVVVYLLKRFVETVCHFAVGSALHDKMDTYAETTFSAALVSNLGKASVYSVVYVPIVFAFDLGAIVLGVVFLAFVKNILVALFLTITAVVLLQALKLTVTNHWLPAMTVDNKKLSAAMRFENKLERKQQFKFFSTYLVSVYLVIIVNVVAAIATIGSALIITIPASYFFWICMQYVNYYTVKGKKYFVTYEDIASNPDHGDSEHFFEYIAEETAEQETTENE